MDLFWVIVILLVVAVICSVCRKPRPPRSGGAGGNDLGMDLPTWVAMEQNLDDD